MVRLPTILSKCFQFFIFTCERALINAPPDIFFASDSTMVRLSKILSICFQFFTCERALINAPPDIFFASDSTMVRLPTILSKCFQFFIFTCEGALINAPPDIFFSLHTLLNLRSNTSLFEQSLFISQIIDSVRQTLNHHSSTSITLAASIRPLDTNSGWLNLAKNCSMTSSFVKSIDRNSSAINIRLKK